MPVTRAGAFGVRSRTEHTEGWTDLLYAATLDAVKHSDTRLVERLLDLECPTLRGQCARRTASGEESAEDNLVPSEYWADGGEPFRVALYSDYPYSPDLLERIANECGGSADSGAQSNTQLVSQLRAIAEVAPVFVLLLDATTLEGRETPEVLQLLLSEAVRYGAWALVHVLLAYGVRVSSNWHKAFGMTRNWPPAERRGEGNAGRSDDGEKVGLSQFAKEWMLGVRLVAEKSQPSTEHLRHMLCAAINADTANLSAAIVAATLLVSRGESLDFFYERPWQSDFSFEYSRQKRRERNANIAQVTSCPSLWARSDSCQCVCLLACRRRVCSASMGRRASVVALPIKPAFTCLRWGGTGKVDLGLALTLTAPV